MKLFYTYIGRLFAYIPILSNVAEMPHRIFSPASNGHRLVMSGRYFLTIFCFMCMVAWQQVSAQTSAPASMIQEPKPLAIGDEIPDELWNLPLQVVNHPEGKETITLGNYKDKLIILDFWATWCGPCIKELPHLLSLQDSIECKVIPLSDESHEKINKFLSQNKGLQNGQFYTYNRGGLIDKAFERNSIPHTVVIYNGSIKAFTLPQLLNTENLNKLTSQSTNTLIPKIELKNSKEDLLQLANQNTSKMEDSGFTILMSHIDGVVPGVYWEPELAKGGSRFQIANYSLLSVLALATGRGEIFLKNPNKIRIQEVQELREITDDEWNYLKDLKLCYEGKYPNSLSYSSAVSRLKKDLTVYKNIECQVETVPAKVVKFNRSASLKVKPTKFQYKISEVVFTLNQIPGTIPIAFEKEQGNEIVYLPHELKMMDRDAVEKLLSEQGWVKRDENRNEEHLVLSWDGFKKEGGIL